jgi:Subtilase family
VITASAGDDGFRNWAAEHASERNITQYPASSPHVVSVGGTRLAPLGLGGAWQGESVWNGSGAGGGGCSVLFTAPAWQQQAADWSAVGCATKRSVSDVSADADPYSGLAIFDSDAPGELCETQYSEGKATRTLEHWCTYGGTSLASPIVASVFALAGGANGIAHPAETLYANERNAPGVFHDVTSGSNGKCASYNHKTGLSSCTATEEAAASCPSKTEPGVYLLSCLAAAGYDGPSGVGTPNGVLGFVPGQHEVPASEVDPATTGGGGEAPRAAPAPASAPASTVAPAVSAPTVKLTAFALTAPALTALSRHRATGRSIVFAFVLNVSSKVRATLTRRVRSHGHTRWVAVGRAATLSAAAGRNVRRLSGATRLPKGAYRLTLTPLSGASRSISFTIR